MAETKVFISYTRRDSKTLVNRLRDDLIATVCETYGWEYAMLDDEEEILRRRLALNLERAR